MSTMWQKYDKCRTIFTNVTQGTSWTKRQRNLMRKCESKMMMMVMVMMMVMMINKMMVIVTNRRWWSRRWWSCRSLLTSLQSQPSKPNFSYMYTYRMGLKKPPQKKINMPIFMLKNSIYFLSIPYPTINRINTKCT